MVARLTQLGVLLGLIVIALGAYTRLTDAGLGCPDWPGCYGHLGVPTQQQDVARAQQYYQQSIESSKAWTEMIHRYLAGSLSCLILALTVVVWRNPLYRKLYFPWCLALCAILIMQAVLGMWTVTWLLLPTVVMAHLLGGLLVVSLLWWMHLKTRKWSVMPENAFYKYGFTLAGMILFLQIALGAWTSTNYAALACAAFPMCNAGEWMPKLDMAHAFHLTVPVGINYSGGHLDAAARATIHFFHRIGALVTTGFLGLLSMALWLSARNRSTKQLSLCILLLLGVQISLGILNVVWHLPLKIAVLHNVVAALLLLVVLALNYVLRVPKSLGVIRG